MTTLTAHSTGQNAGLLTALLDALAPAVGEAARTATGEPERVTATVTLDPLALRVAHHDRDGRRRIFAAMPDGAVVHAVGELTVAGLNKLPVSSRLTVASLMESGQASLAIQVEPPFETATGYLLVGPQTTDDPAESDRAVVLFALTTERMH